MFKAGLDSLARARDQREWRSETADFRSGLPVDSERPSSRKNVPFVNRLGQPPPLDRETLVPHKVDLGLLGQRASHHHPDAQQRTGAGSRLSGLRPISTQGAHPNLPHGRPPAERASATARRAAVPSRNAAHPGPARSSTGAPGGGAGAADDASYRAKVFEPHPFDAHAKRRRPPVRISVDDFAPQSVPRAPQRSAARRVGGVPADVQDRPEEPHVQSLREIQKIARRMGDDDLSSNGLIWVDVKEGDLPILARHPVAKREEPSTLVLTNLKLREIPTIICEKNLQSLILRHNFLKAIERIEVFSHLLLLDVRNNLLRSLEGLQMVTTLQILKASKNLLEDIEGVSTLVNLKILELSGNKIADMKGVEALTSLRKLDLTSNWLSKVEHVEGCVNLKQLFLRRNQITHAVGLECCVRLHTLDLSKNQIAKFEDIGRVEQCPCLVDLALNGNPLCIAEGYDLDVVMRMRRLVQLDQSAIDVHLDGRQKVAARAEMQRSEPAGTVESEAAIPHNHQHELARIKAKEHWERAHSAASATDAAACGVHFCTFHEEPGKVHLCGCGSISQYVKSGAICPLDVHTIVLEFMTFDEISSQMHFLTQTCRNVENLEMICTSVVDLLQLNKLASLVPHLLHLDMSTAGNPVTSLPYWREYVTYRFSTNGCFRSLNGREIGDGDREKARRAFQVLTGVLQGSYSASDSRSHETSNGCTEESVVSAAPVPGAEDQCRLPCHHRAGERTAEVSDKTKKSVPNVELLLDVDSIISAGVHLHDIQSSFQRLWPRIGDSLVLDALLRMQNMRAYETEAMDYLLEAGQKS